MKNNILHNIRSRRFSVALIALICATLVIWGWEKTPTIMYVLPPLQQLDVSPAVIMGTSHVDHSIQQSSGEEDKFLVYSNVTMKTEDEVPIPPPTSSVLSLTDAPQKSEHESNTTLLSVERKACNFAKGKWVADGKRPLYSGFGCKQWLSGMWACRFMKRPDFSYENFRWQPDSCVMPDFDGPKFLRRMKDKTIAFVGDSLGRQQFQSLMCMVTGGKVSPEVKDVGKEYGLVKARGAVRPDGWAYRFPRTNTTILYYWSASLCELQPLNRQDPSTNYAMHLDRPVTFLVKYLERFDVLVLNTGHHWNRGKINGNRWIMYEGGEPITNIKLAEIGRAKNLTIHSVVKWLDSQLPRHPHLKAFFRSLSPRHFVGGDWNSGGSCDNMNPLSHGNQILQDGSSDILTESAVKGTRVKLLDITALSQLRDEAHISRFSVKSSTGAHDCLHWCLPGIPDTWNEILAAELYATMA